MNYNDHMANFWKIYTPSEKVEGRNAQDAQNPEWEESEDAELEKLARRATASARQSFHHINAAKADACKKQLLQEMRDAR